MGMDRINKALSKFGLTENETAVYLVALKEKDELSPYKISELTGIPRTTVYEIIMSLSLKGLIELYRSDGMMKQQTKVKAKNPSELRSILWKRRKELVETEIDILDVLPDLKGYFHKEEPNADFKFYPGIEGAKQVYFGEDTEGVDLPIVTFENLMPVDVFGRQELQADIKKVSDLKKNAKIKVKELIVLNDWTRHILTYQVGRDSNYLKARDIRFIDNPSFNIDQRIAIQGNRTRITCVKDNEVWGLIINSSSLAKTLKSIFEILWQTAGPVTKELVDSWGENEFLKVEKERSQTTLLPKRKYQSKEFY